MSYKQILNGMMDIYFSELELRTSELHPEAMMNVSSSLEIVSLPLGEPLISDHITNYILFTLSFVILLFSLPAVFFNILNVYIFVNTKLDSVTVCFISLALSDLSAMLVLATVSVFSTLVSFGVSWSKNLPTYSRFFIFFFTLSIDLSSATTTYIAVQRGLCVTFPFITRHVFNKNRSLIICVAIFLVMLTIWLPRFSTFILKTIPDPADNSSKLVVFEYFESWNSFDYFYLIFVKSLLAVIEYVIMVICTVAISIGMKSSMKLKQKSNSYSSQTQYGTDAKKSKEEKDKKYKDETKGSEKEQGQKKDSKELLVVKQSLIVVLIHVILTTPRILACVYQVSERRFHVGEQFHNLYFTTHSIVNVIDATNAFVNFFVYVKFNSKYRNYLFSKIFKQRVKL
ncbi:hypothetical protein RRG08_035967 [Elysia crispata]|uniref:G-protein coupled receptors family 1 profile domain-containing protein n=1 Tax=Elysia crispata TaxID=231223 RepID=A0AAE1E3J0_9GAST|nr:hypothetical protein RRG08_035967 [Elysia crispata]